MATTSRYQGELTHHHCLQRYTSWRVGGAAEQFYQPTDLKDLQHFLHQHPEEKPLLWLGLGSNLLVRDQGVFGTVIATLNRLNVLDMTEKNTVRAEAGVTCAKLARFCAKRGFEAGSFFAGIPGTVGGALAMNAGAFGHETWHYVVGIETLDAKGRLHIRTPADYAVSYRSVEGPAKEWFAAGYFAFPTGDTQRAFEAIRHLLRERARTQPIGYLNCGSVFRNPPGDYAARLIETAGLKGFKIGHAIVSDKHANFIINQGEASAKDIEAVISEVAQRVKKVHGIELHTEVKIVGQ